MIRSTGDLRDMASKKRGMAFFDALADLPLRIDGYDLQRLERETPEFTRVTTEIHLHGDDETGRGEDVTYDAPDHDALQNWTGEFPLAGEYTLREFSEILDEIDIFPTNEPERETAHHYRRWAFESAALDLTFRQSDTTLGAVLGRDPQPVHFVASTRLGEPPTLDRIETVLAVNPALEFKLDPTSAWSDELIDDLAATAIVRILDLKSFYEDTEVDQKPDSDLYRRVIESFPEAIIEDPALTEATRPLFDGHETRVSWDYPVVDVASIENLPFEPHWLNVKPSRFGTVEELLDALEYCIDHDIHCYGGGQFELGAGRGQIQELAAIFYADSPNDVAPRAYNDPEPSGGLPTSPLASPEYHVGFGW